jgi:hypothetical protein
MEQVEKKFADLENIPFLIIKAYGIISKAKYARLRKNDFWLDNRCSVCDVCYMKFTEHLTHDKKQAPRAKRTLSKMRSSKLEDLLGPPRAASPRPATRQVRRLQSTPAAPKCLDKLSTKEEEEILKQLHSEPRPKFEHRKDYDPSRVYGKKSLAKKPLTHHE